jgi:type I restriction enzyme S subunit
MSLTVSPEEIVSTSKSPLLSKHPEWPRIRLGEVAEVINGAAFESRFFGRESGGLPLVRIRDVGRQVSETFYSGPYEDRYVLGDGDLLIGMDGDFRIAEWNGGTALLNQRVCKLVVKEVNRMAPRFLLYVLPGYLDAIHARTSSVTVKHLSSKTVLDLPIPLPPLKEQAALIEEIEKQFTRLSSALSVLSSTQARASVLREAILQDLLQVAAPRVQLAEVATTASGGTPHRAKPHYYGGEIPWLKSGELRDGPVLDTEETITGEGLEHSSAKVFPVGTVCMAMYGATIGRLGILEIAAATNQAICGMSPGPKLDRDFLFYALMAQRRRLIGSGKGGAQNNIGQGIIRKAEIPLPSLEHQAELVEKVQRQLSVVESTLKEAELQRRRAAVLRNAILGRAFSGQLLQEEVA